jgi:hypothetical protein
VALGAHTSPPTSAAKAVFKGEAFIAAVNRCATQINGESALMLRWRRYMWSFDCVAASLPDAATSLGMTP